MLSMLLSVFGDEKSTGEHTYAVHELYQKALGIMLTRVLWVYQKLDSAFNAMHSIILMHRCFV